ncbi:hypothetical protein [Prosthecomicrobium pneumaticum]|uniref:Uncharacterized protein n=1 Tax=Prosthecomicrobium pneumaticum TaxID=81895 RepID=A0A7W9FLH5_9HYPH|nr:hypothetical protein [Prosthecomicrobium pneumaticum]MBB5752867.1 hypothetical protein [Prosthecomicrobium pneumaticum]
MSPDVFTDLQVLNATASGLYPGSGGSNKGFCHSYQMWYWFGCKEEAQNYPSPVVERAKAKTYRLQFKRGVGDQDDGADMQLNVGDKNTGDCNVVYVKGRSDNRSVHFLSAEVQTPNLTGRGPFVVAFNERGKWPTLGPGPLQWKTPEQSFAMPMYNDDQCLAIIDLGIWVPPFIADVWLRAMRAGTFGGNDAIMLWTYVMRYLDGQVDG